MGGSSSINSMAHVRGNKVDYDTWAAMGNEGWSYKDVSTKTFRELSFGDLLLIQLTKQIFFIHAGLTIF